MGKPRNQVAIIKGAPVTQTLSMLETAVEQLKRIQETPWKTNGDFGAGFKNIKSDNTISLRDLIRMEAQAHTQHELFHASAERLGLAKYPAFEINGHDYESWHHDIKLRMAINEQEERFNTLKAFQDEMKQFLSKEDQKAQLEEKIANYFQNM